jgi:uncharacterized damage-inducible protein DinB
MDTTYMRKLFEYDRWANARTQGAASRLTREQFLKDLGSSHRSIRDTLVHILSAQRTWLSRWKGSSPRRMLDPSQFGAMEDVRALSTELERELGAFLDSLTDGGLRSVVPYQTLDGKSFAHPLWVQMAHLLNHSTYHRGQVTTMLRQLGAEPVATDLILFFREQQSR